MSYRKILYGYQIQNGELTLVPEEAAVVNFNTCGTQFFQSWDYSRNRVCVVFERGEEMLLEKAV